ncbi:MAG: response regulator, partial [Candidatus Methylomirabilia bacterium]
MADFSRVPTILCVDDDVAFLNVLKEYFTLCGFNVLTVTNGEAAVSHVTRYRPNAVILDMFMHGLDGAATLQHIRRLNPKMVVILVSGVANAVEMLEQAGVSVASAFVKPVNPDQI